VAILSELATVGEFDSALAPADDLAGELLVLLSVDPEFLLAKPWETIKDLGEQGRREPEVFLRRELTEPIEALPRLERHQVDEVSGLSPAEHCKHLVDREFLTGERRRQPAWLHGKESGIRPQVQFRPVIAALDDQASEAWILLDVAHDEPRILQSALDGREEPIYRVSCESEEVEVARLAANVASDDQRGAAGEREAFRFLEAGDDLGDLLLQRAEHLRGVTTALNPACPRLPNRERQYELVPELQQPVGVDVEAHVVCGSLSQDLFVDTGTIAAVVDVIGQGCAAPANVEGKLDSAARLRQRLVVEVGGHGDWPRGGAKRASSCLCHLEPSLRTRESRATAHALADLPSLLRIRFPEREPQSPMTA